MRKKKLKNNPYIFSYLTFALLCCIGFSIVFLYTNIENMKKTEIENNQTKLELIANDFETQLKTFKKINLKIQVNSIYKPKNFERNKYNETVLLDDFEQFKDYSPLAGEYLLYYCDMTSLFSSYKTTITLHVWLNRWSREEQEEVLAFLNAPEQISILPLASGDCFLIRYPLSGMSKPGTYDSALYVLVEKASLIERFQVVSGGLSGEFALLNNEQLIISTDSDFDYTDSKVLSVTTKTNGYTFYFLPDKENSTAYAVMPMQVSLIFAVFIFILYISTIFASHSYKPILKLSEKYRNILTPDNENHFTNELENLDHMMDSVIKHNIAANSMLEQKQAQLRNQLLLLLLSGKVSFEVHPYLMQLSMPFPGPWYFVVCIHFQQESCNDNALLGDIQKMLEAVGCPDEDKYIYCVIEQEEQLINCLCSVSEKIQKEEILDEILIIAENFEDKMNVGYGNEYTNIHNLSASYLDALDKLHDEQNADIISVNNNALQDHSLLSQLCAALIQEKAEPAKEVLTQYIQRIKEEAPSLLMQQYMFSNFLNEMNHIYRKNELEMPKQYMSLILSAKGIAQFSQAAKEIVQDFSAQLSAQKRRFLDNASEQVLQYMKEHFTDYDMSIEKVVEYTNTNSAFVRNVIKEHCGMSYIDYLIHLRIEYAKKLLITENLTVAETCEKIGYAKVSYFIKVFKTHTGVTPATFKKNGR